MIESLVEKFLEASLDQEVSDLVLMSMMQKRGEKTAFSTKDIYYR
jgi:hypothetical protein